MLGNLTLRMKLLLGFSISAVFLLLVGVINFFAVQGVTATFGVIPDIDVPNIFSLSEMRSLADDIRAKSNRMGIATIPPEEFNLIVSGVGDDISRYAAADKAYTSIDWQKGEKELYDPMNVAWQEYMVAINKVTQFGKAGDAASRAQMIDILTRDTRTLAQKYVQANQKLTGYWKRTVAERSIAARAAGAFYRYLSAGAVVMGLAFAMLVGIVLARALTRDLQNVISDLDTASAQTLGASGQVASSSQALARGASEQAASVEETSSTLEEISSMTRQNADNAAKVEILARQAQESTHRGSEAMGR